MTITLATLSEASKQEIFDQVAAHLLKQGVPSKSELGVCAYRGVGGKMCAAGCLIADSEYHPKMDSYGDGLDWDDGVIKGIFPHVHSAFIRELQEVHDGSVERWEYRLKQLAESHELEYKEKTV